MNNDRMLNELRRALNGPSWPERVGVAIGHALKWVLIGLFLSLGFYLGGWVVA